MNGSPDEQHPPSDGFSNRERRLFAAWRTPEPPDDFATRVVGQYRAGGAGSTRLDTFRGLAVAATLVLAVGGLVAARAIGGGPGRSSLARPAPAAYSNHARVGPPDAGPREAGFDG